MNMLTCNIQTTIYQKLYLETHTQLFCMAEQSRAAHLLTLSNLFGLGFDKIFKNVQQFQAKILLNLR